MKKRYDIFSKGWKLISRQDGFTLIELALVLMLVGILASMFSGMIVAAMDIYADHTMRKTIHTDSRRAFEQLTRDLRELTAWQGSPSQTAVDFYRYILAKSGNRIYYAPLRTRYNLVNGMMTYQRSDGNWNNQYTLIESGVQIGSAFSTVTEGGKTRVRTYITVMSNNKPLRLRVTAYPRIQG